MYNLWDLWWFGGNWSVINRSNTHISDKGVLKFLQMCDNADFHTGVIEGMALRNAVMDRWLDLGGSSNKDVSWVCHLTDPAQDRDWSPLGRWKWACKVLFFWWKKHCETLCLNITGQVVHLPEVEIGWKPLWLVLYYIAIHVVLLLFKWYQSLYYKTKHGILLQLSLSTITTFGHRHHTPGDDEKVARQLVGQ